MENQQPIIITDPRSIKDIVTEVFKELIGGKQEAKPENDVYKDVDQAAAFLNVSKQTIYSYTSTQKIPFYKRQKRIYFKQTDLELWLNDGRVKTGAEIEEAASARTSKKKGGTE